jgi:hypothetical protein
MFYCIFDSLSFQIDIGFIIDLINTSRFYNRFFLRSGYPGSQPVSMDLDNMKKLGLKPSAGRLTG